MLLAVEAALLPSGCSNQLQQQQEQQPQQQDPQQLLLQLQQQQQQQQLNSKAAIDAQTAALVSHLPHDNIYLFIYLFIYLSVYCLFACRLFVSFHKP